MARRNRTDAVRVTRRGAVGAALAIGLPVAATAGWGEIERAALRPLRRASTDTATRVAVSIDAAAPGRPISPLIYGVAHAGPEGIAETGARLHRWGGNPNTRHNWAHGSAWNSARDWEFRNGGQAPHPGGQASRVADTYVEMTRGLGVEVFLTVPAIGWVARDHHHESRSVGVPDRGGLPVAGRQGGIAGYDPAANRRATSVRSVARKGAPFADPPDPGADVVYQDEWVHHLVRRFGPADAGGVRYYAVDNEPDLWAETHTDVHPARLGYDDLLAVFLEYATAIKDVDPTAQVAGPAVSGWSGLWWSPRDRTDSWSLPARAVRRLLPGGLKALTEPDRRAHGGTPFLPWWLDGVRRHDQRAGRRTLDVLDVHFYPQAPDVFAAASEGAKTDAATNALRLRSTRALWDETYVDESWINEPVRLIPRLREWIDRYYPGTRLAIGEWNWGADGTVNGALAVAEVLGILGREGVDLAAYWTVPPAGSPGALAFRLYTNVDGRGGHFGDRSLPARSSDPAAVSAYASRDSASGELIVVALNKQPDAGVEAEFELTGFPAGPAVATVHRYGQADPQAIRAAGEAAVTGGRLSLALPPYSATVVRVGTPRGGRG